MIDEKNMKFFESSSTFFQEKKLPQENSSEKSDFNKFGYRSDNKRLYEARANVKYKSELLFQLITDYQYMNANIDLKGKKILLHCVKAGGRGDVAHTFRCAELIKQKFPDCKIKIAIECPLFDEQEVKAMFPLDRFETVFVPSNDYYKKEDLMKIFIEESDCMLGIAVPISSPELTISPLFRNIREYGYWKSSEPTKGNLSMGFSENEEGLNFPLLTPRKLINLETEWLKKSFNINSTKDESDYIDKNKLYHMYMPESRWTMKILAIYSISELEKNNSNPIDIFLPLSKSLADLITWNALQIDFLKNNNIGTLISINEKGEEKIVLNETGKTMRIFSGIVTKNDAETIEEHSQPFFGCTGNLSLSAAFMRSKLPLYAHTGLGDIMKPWNSLLEKTQYKTLKQFHDLIIEFDKKEDEIYDKNTQRKISYYQPDQSVDLSHPNSLTRKSIPDIAKILPYYAISFAKLVNEDISKEAKEFGTDMVNNFNVAPRLIAMVFRGLVLKAHPELLKIEQELCRDFIKGTKQEENVVNEFSEHVNNYCSGNIKAQENSVLVL